MRDLPIILLTRPATSKVCPWSDGLDVGGCCALQRPGQITMPWPGACRVAVSSRLQITTPGQLEAVLRPLVERPK